VAISVTSWQWPKIYKALKNDARITRGGSDVMGGVKQSTVERIEGETEEEKVEPTGASCDTVMRTQRRFLYPHRMHVY
jgi:hypothetical protein